MSIIKQKFKDRLYIKRMIIMVIGVVFLGLGVSLLKMLNFGTEPFSSSCFGISTLIQVPFGVCQMSIGLIMFLLVLIFCRDAIGPGTIFNMFFVGYIADFFTYVLKSIVLSYDNLSLTVRIVILIPAMLVFLLGAVLYMTARAGVAPYDALPVFIARKIKKVSFRTVRMCWDGTFALFSFLIGGPIGIVTILSILTVGPCVSFFGKIVEKKFFTAQ